MDGEKWMANFMQSLIFMLYNQIDLQIQESINNFKSLSLKGIHTIVKINWWLLKYYDLYKYCNENWNNGSCFGELACSHTIGSEMDKFRDFYESLEEVANLHKKETYFREQMQILEIVRNDSPALMKWMLQNEKLGVEDFLIFWIEWYEEERKVLDPNINNWEKQKILFKADEWKYTIKFLKVFNELYWTSEICKEN